MPSVVRTTRGGRQRERRAERWVKRGWGERCVESEWGRVRVPGGEKL